MKHILSILVAFAAIASSVACSGRKEVLSQETVARTEAGIINGEEVKPDDIFARHTVRLFMKSNNVYYPICSASIVADDLILTAVHCVDGSSEDELLIGFGAQPVSYSSQQNAATRVDVKATFKVAELEAMVLNPTYDGYSRDVALIRIKTKIPAGFEPVKLLPLEMLNTAQTETVFEGKFIPVVLAGFGVTDERKDTESLVLRKATVNADFKGKQVITDQTQGYGGCFGDSGGPAFLQLPEGLFLVGVTHGPAAGSSSCYERGLWWNPSLEREFLNKSAETMGSVQRF